MDDDKNIYKTRQTLLEKIKDKHDDESWQEFAFYYDRFIYTICRKMNINHHDAEEVVQKVLLISWKKMPDFKYDDSKQFRGWLCNLTKMCVMDFYRTVKRYNDKITKASEKMDVEGVEKRFNDISLIVEDEWKTYIMNMALMNVKDVFSESVLDIFLRLVEGERPNEVAEDLGIPPNTVRVYKKRVLDKLNEEVKRLNDELG